MPGRVSLLLFAFWGVLGRAQDVVIFRNGDQLAGKIERMEKGKVTGRDRHSCLSGRREAPALPLAYTQRETWGSKYPNQC